MAYYVGNIGKYKKNQFIKKQQTQYCKIKKRQGKGGK